MEVTLALRQMVGSYSPHIVLFSDLDCLTLEIIKELQVSPCQVTVISKHIDEARDILKHHRLSGRVNVISKQQISGIRKIDYFIYLFLEAGYQTYFSNYDEVESEIEFSKSLILKYSSRSLFVFSYSLNRSLVRFIDVQSKKILEDKNLNSSVVFLGDIVVERNGGRKENHFNCLLNEILTVKSKVFNDDSLVFYPVNCRVAASSVVRNLFSLKTFGKRTAVIGSPLKVGILERLVADVDLAVKFYFKKKVDGILNPSVDEKIVVEEDVVEILKEIIGSDYKLKRRDYIKKISPVKFSKEKDVKFTRQKDYKRNHKESYSEEGFFKELQKSSVFNNRISKACHFVINEVCCYAIKSYKRYIGGSKEIIGGYFKKWKYKLAFFFLVIITGPFILLLISLVPLLFARQVFLSGNVNRAKILLDTSAVIARGANDYSKLLSTNKLLKNPYEDVTSACELLINTSEVGNSFIDVYEKLFEIKRVISGSSDYDIEQVSEDLSLELDIVYKELGFLQADLEDSSSSIARVINKSVIQGDIGNLREDIKVYQKFIPELPSLLGRGKPASYLLIFQDSTTLRPTGGLIDSYAQVTFSNGEISDFQIYDVSFADKKLNGIVEAPYAVERYLETDTWYLRDSNWDSNFPMSAVKAEWFLDKELELDFDGVIAINLEFIKELMKDTNELQIESDGFLISHNNLFELVSSEEDREGYPHGIYESLIRKVVEERISAISNYDRSEMIKFVKVIFESFNSKDLQVFLHNQRIQRIILDLNWGGSIDVFNCEDNCHSDLVGVVEANLGKGDSHLIKREYQIDSSLEDGIVKKELRVYIENPNEAVYKAYYRVIVNKDSSFSPVEVISKDSSEELLPDVFGLGGFKSAGVFVELGSRKAVAIIFNWENSINIDFKQDGEYILNLRKQSGVTNSAFEIRVDVPKDMSIVNPGLFVLTDIGSYEYNTTLYRDLIMKLRWIETDR